MKEITIEYKYTLEEAVRAGVEVTASVIKYIRILPYFGGLMIFSAVYTYLMYQLPPNSIVLLLVLGTLFASMPLITRLTARQRARKLPSLNNLVTWRVTEAELITSTEGAEGRFVWDKVMKVHERKLGFLLFPQPRLAHWIPKRGFQNEEGIRLFRELVKAKGIEFKG